ncbi:titin isoform X2 [Drosophila miranda]|uniref:titin isoform X2 n=1 Tax=Drosophila miranda TaxID=7229 RepID=UPI0007E6C022|nr:titin isoform X2 [Drosophila miranda]
MEDVEYLDEYKDLVLPGIKTGDGRTPVAPRRRQISSDSSNSSSIDADIFQKLFHEKFIDDEQLNEGSSKSREKHRPRIPSSSDDGSNDAFDALFHRKLSKPKSNKRRERFASFDSVDELGQALMRPTQRSTVPKPSTSRGAGRKSETEGLHRGSGSQSNSSGFGKSNKSLPKHRSSGKIGVRGLQSKNATKGSSTASSSHSVSKNSKTVTLHKPDLRLPKNEPKTDPLNLGELYGDSDSDSSYEFESDFFDDPDTDDEEPVIDLSTDTSRTTSVAESARRKQQQQRELEKTGKDKQGQKKLVRRRNQLEAEERPPQKRLKPEDEATASAPASANPKAKFISLIGKDTIISTTTDLRKEEAKSSGAARKSNAKSPKGADMTKHIIISTVPKKTPDAAAESPPAPSKKPLVQSVVNSFVDTRKTTQRDSTGKKFLPRSNTAAANDEDPERNIPSSTLLTRKGVVPASDLPSKKTAEYPKGETPAAALRKVNIISVSVMPSKEDECAAVAVGKKGPTSAPATAAQVTKALMDAEKNIVSARRQVEIKKKPENKKIVKINAPDKTKNTEQARKEDRRLEMSAQQSKKSYTHTEPTTKSLPHPQLLSNPEPRKSEDAARKQTDEMAKPAMLSTVRPVTDAASRLTQPEQQWSDLDVFRKSIAIRKPKVETSRASRESSHERAGRITRLEKGNSLPTSRPMAVSISSHMTRAASNNRSLASTPIPMATTPTPIVRRTAPKKPELEAASSSPVEPLAPPKKVKRPARLRFGSRRRRSAKKRKATEEAEAETEVGNQKRSRGEQEQEQEPEARPAPSLAFPVMITAASSSTSSPLPYSVTAPVAVAVSSKSQPIRKHKLRKCVVKINPEVVNKWMAANVRKQPAVALQQPRSEPPEEPAPEPQIEEPAAEPARVQVPEPAPAPAPAPSPAPEKAPQTARAPVAPVDKSDSVSVSALAQPAQKKTHGVLAMKLPIPIPVMEIKTEIEEMPPKVPMEEDTLGALPVPIAISTPIATPITIPTAPEAPEEATPPQEVVSLPPTTSSFQTIRISAPPPSAGRLVSSLPSASSAESSQKPGHTKIFSFLYPHRYQRSYGDVGLDFCCPNLDGPMRAIDPTRLHATAQVPVLELPQFMVITTKIISKADKDLPYKVRAKLAQLDKTGGKLVGQTVRMSMDSSEPSIPVAVPSSNLGPAPRTLPALIPISNPPPPTAPPAPTAPLAPTAPPAPTTTPALPVSHDEDTVQSLTKQLPRGTTLTKKVLPPGAALPAAASSSMVASMPPALIQLPPICPKDKQRVELQSRVQIFDLVLQSLSRRVTTLTKVERQRTIEEIVMTSTLMPIDVDVGTKLLENYVYYLNRATNIQTPLPSLCLNPVVTTAATQSAPTVASLVGIPAVAKSKVSTASASASATATATPSAPAPATKKPAQKRSSLPAGIPVYDSEKNIIGYQCPTPNASFVNRPTPMASSTSLGPSAFTAAQGGSKSARSSVQLKQNKKTKTTAGMPMKAGPKGSTGNRVGSGTIISIHPPPEQKTLPARPGVAQTIAALSETPQPNAVAVPIPVPVPGSTSKSAAPTSSGRSAGLNQTRSPNVFIINQMSPQAEESILPDSNNVVPMEAEIKGELDDTMELIG